MRTTCYYDDGDCSIQASYDTAENKTYWVAACNDGGVYDGVIGGNEIPAICGA